VRPLRPSNPARVKYFGKEDFLRLQGANKPATVG